jgi:hypothetical protein
MTSCRWLAVGHDSMAPKRQKWRMKRIIVSAVLSSLVVACASAPPPPPMMAADNGQREMQAALTSLEHARTEAQAASTNKGGHRERAIGLIQRAESAVNAAMQYAAAHPTEIGDAEVPAASKPVDERVPGAESQPHMWRAIVALREARKHLGEARHDKGGDRVQAISLTQQALDELRQGIAFANR